MSDHDPVPDPIERMLDNAFRNRPGMAATPSLVDVRQRARRSQRRRAGSVVGAAALVGVGGVGVLAQRDDRPTTAGDSPTTSPDGRWSNCSPGTATTTWVVDGSWPAEESISTDSVQPTTTTVAWATTTDLAPADPTIAPDASYPPVLAPCTPTAQFRCLGNNGTDEQGYTYFEYCEPVSGYPTVTTIAEFVPTDSTTPGMPMGTTTTATEQVPTTSLEFAPTTTDMAPTTTP